MDKYVYKPKVKMSDGTFKDAYINAECIDGLPNIPKEIFDVVVTTQAEFDRLILSSNWNNAKSVAFIGDGGTLQFVANTTRIEVPANVKRIKGFNKATIHVNGYIGTTPSDTYHPGALTGSSSDETDPTIVEDIRLYITLDSSNYQSVNHGFAFFQTKNCYCYYNTVSSSRTYRGFYNCNNVEGCVFEFNKYANCNGFYECKNLSNCVAIIKNGRDVFGFCYCNYMTNCRAELSSSVTTFGGFKYCKGCSSCYAYVSDSVTAGNCHGFLNCYSVSACEAIIAGGEKAYGFYNSGVLSGNISAGTGQSIGHCYYNCSYCSSCKIADVSNAYTTAVWGGTNTKRDDDSCDI